MHFLNFTIYSAAYNKNWGGAGRALKYITGELKKKIKQQLLGTLKICLGNEKKNRVFCRSYL